MKQNVLRLGAIMIELRAVFIAKNISQVKKILRRKLQKKQLLIITIIAVAQALTVIAQVPMVVQAPTVIAQAHIVVALRKKSSSSTGGYSSYSSGSSSSSPYKSYDEGYEAVYDDDDYDWDRYNSDSDYAEGVDDALDELDD